MRRCRCATCSTRATTSSMPPTAPSPPSFRAWKRRNCGAGFWARRADVRARGACGGAWRNWSRPGPNWRRRWMRRCRPPERCPEPDGPTRLAAEAPDLGGVETGRPNPTEALLHAARTQVLARAPNADAAAKPWNATCTPSAPLLARRGRSLTRALARIAEPLNTLVARLAARLDDEAEELDEATRDRIEGSCRSIRPRAHSIGFRRGRRCCAMWPRPAPSPAIDRNISCSCAWTGGNFGPRESRGGMRDYDVGLHRHWLDPTIPFMATLAEPAHGLLVTSATLRDGGERDAEIAWLAAEGRIGAPHLPSPAIRVAVASPFDYAAQTRAFVVTDVESRDIRCIGRRLPRAVPRRRAAARWVCSPRSNGSRRSMRASRRTWKLPAFRCSRSMSTRWIMRRWSMCFAPRRKAACSARTRCATVSTCRAARCALSSSSGFPGRGRTSCIASGASISADGNPARVRRPAGATAPAPGIRPPYPHCHGPRRIRSAGPPNANTAALRVPARRCGAPRRVGRSSDRDRVVSTGVAADLRIVRECLRFNG